MQQIRITELIDRPVLIPLKSLVYPADEKSIYHSVTFGNRPIKDSVQYKTCFQIEQGVSTADLDYYHWTREKMVRFGRRYERFLATPGKGCVIEKSLVDRTAHLPVSERHHLLAEAATRQFEKLFVSIMGGWRPDANGQEIHFYRLLLNRYALKDGRHRIGILVYKYRNTNDVCIETDAHCIETGYYWTQVKGVARRLLREPK